MENIKKIKNNLIIILAAIFCVITGINSQTIINEPVENAAIITSTSSVSPGTFYIGESITPGSKFTNFYFGIPKDQDIKITITDMLGKEINIVASGRFKAGIYKAELNNLMKTSGVYFYKIESSEYTEIKKFTVII